VALNPLTGAVDGFRWSLLGDRAALHPPSVAISIGVGSALLASGLWFFRRSERSFADVI
jgi:lipopolysaccharide transport system permease protein